MYIRISFFLLFSFICTIPAIAANVTATLDDAAARLPFSYFGGQGGSER